MRPGALMALLKRVSMIRIHSGAQHITAGQNPFSGSTTTTPRASEGPLWHTLSGDERIQRASDDVQVVGEEPGVDVEGHSRGGVAKHLLDGLHVGARRDGERRSRMTEVVGREVDETGPLHGGVEDAAAPVVEAQRTTPGRESHESARRA